MIPTPEDPSQASPLQLALIEKIIRLHPDTAPFLESETLFQLLIAVILSAQCTDAKVNEVTRVLPCSARFPTRRGWPRPRWPTSRKIVYPTGFYRDKAAHIIETAFGSLSKNRHGGEVPLAMEALTALPG